MDATLQVRMDADVKEKVEQLYRGMGTTFAEVIGMLAVQSLIENGIPFQLNDSKGKAFGIASKRANPALMTQEEGAFARAMVKKRAID